MHKKLKKLIQTYIDGWKENNIEKILRPLINNCIIIESHGPTYHGKQQIKQWFEFWEKEKGKVLHWDITSFFFIEKENTVFFEWDFSCNVRNTDYHLPGISIVKIVNNKISYIHEYRMTHISYNWKAKELNPN